MPIDEGFWLKELDKELLDEGFHTRHSKGPNLIDEDVLVPVHDEPRETVGISEHHPVAG
jgi:hypothetical protein